MIKQILNHPDVIVRKLFRNQQNEPFQCTNYQRNFLVDVLNKKHTKYMFVASTRAGKSEITSIAAVLLALYYPGEQIQILSPTRNQTQIVFKKIRRHITNHPYLFQQVDTSNEFSNQEVNFYNGSYIHCLSVGGAKKGAQVLGFGGSVIIIDESEEVEDDAYKLYILRMLATATRQSILIELGTPHRANHFKSSFQSGNFKIYQVNYKQAVKENIINEREVELIRQELTDIEFRVWYCAEFPDEDEDSLFTLAELTKLRENKKKIQGEKILGVDVARFGSDKTVLTYVEKDDDDYIEIKQIWSYQKKDTMQTVSKIMQLHEEYEFDTINVDVIGLGSGVFDRLSEEELPVQACHFGQTPTRQYTQYDDIQTKRDWFKKQKGFNYMNKKAEQYFRIKKLLEDERISNNVTKDSLNKLFADMSKMRFEFTTSKKIRICEWERLSPDFADSLVYACWSEGSGFHMQFAKLG